MTTCHVVILLQEVQILLMKIV